MKRIITTLLITLLMFSSLAVNISAAYEAKTYDSMTLDPHELNAIYRSDSSITSKDTVIKMYRTEVSLGIYGERHEEKLGVLMKWFAEHETIDMGEFLTTPNIRIYYFIAKEDGANIIKSTSFDGDYSRPGAHQLIKTYTYDTFGLKMEFIKYAIEPEKIFDSSVTINNIYYVMDRFGDCIYYETSDGVFILNRFYMEDIQSYVICLFPLDVFLSLNKNIYEQRRKLYMDEEQELLDVINSVNIGKITSEEEMKPYFVEVNNTVVLPTQTDPAPTDTEAVSTEPADKAWWSSISPWTWVAVVCGSVAVIGTVTLATVFIIRKKKTKS